MSVFRWKDTPSQIVKKPKRPSRAKPVTEAQVLKGRHSGYYSKAVTSVKPFKEHQE